MTVKFSYETVKQILKNEGYVLISTEYNGSGKKIELLCPNNHSWTTTLNNFTNQKSRCPGCSDKTIYNTEIVKNILAKEGYGLITLEYKNMHQKLDMLCPKGHIYSTSFCNYMGNGCRCFTCSGIKRYSYGEIFDILKKEGYELLTDNYKNAQQKLDVICPVGHHISFAMNWFLSRGSRCKQCSPNRPHSIKSIREFVEKEGYKLISEVYITGEKLILLCPNEHEYRVTFENFKGHNRRCPECTGKGTSKTEQELLSWVKDLYPSAKMERFRYDPDNGKRFLELDIYIEDIRLGIEFNGLIWHSEKFKIDKKYHINKMKLANKLGIRLITIFEDEWLERKEQVKGYLKSVLNKNEIKLFARKTELKEVPKKEAKEFLEAYHIQGSPNFEVAFGLYHNNELVAIITGNAHHRQGHGHIFVLNRLCFKENVSIAGGSSKLLKHLLNYAKSHNYDKLLSWSDNRFSEGRVYETLGFILEDEHSADYSYVKKQTRISKQSCQKKQLLRKGAQGTMENTERELALTLGLWRIWDCGKKAWAIDLDK